MTDIKTIAVIVYIDENGKRVEREWDNIPEEERLTISKILTERFMEAAGLAKSNT